ncbi:MAG: response regulator [Coriobacteriales bacterium]|nr:response regulator [Coriobacteriaceae bacterium]MDY2723741.1 response regulator [Coriobacteriales bacterium]
MIFEAMIADDEAPARVELRNQLEDTGRVKVVAEAVSFPEAVAKIVRGGLDVVFLDWDIADPSSPILKEALPKVEHPPLIVFMSAYAEYEPEAFGVKPLCHLAKPTDRKALEACIKIIEHRHLELIERRAR